ncbi:MAG: cysteine--tRNA ligase [Candidatus Aenigmarchaeota archaeon ex4484_56]|nr:MAG: cysteine--tRNA ligase [Candidatus Aenigmarchaeota archaeon ex4484_56]
MQLKLYNTLTRKKEIFKPLKDNIVGLYSCGPTVYSYAHIGHFRTYIFVDTLKRVLRYNNYRVKHVMNITDVGHLTSDADTGEDKLEKEARIEKKNVWEIAEYYTKDFFNAMEKLNVEKPDIVCKATEHIQDMLKFIEKIEEKGYTYRTSDGIYFDTSKLDDYGKLARLNIKGLEKGKRVEFKEKRNVTDFALWKFSPKDKKRQMEWESKWGVGFPGWHIECSAMSMKYLGEVFDIHTGGVDHIPIHHTNERAQAKAVIGKEFVRYWLHNELVMVDGEKMSKSKRNFLNMEDIEKRGFDPISLRYLFLATHYRAKLNFTLDSLKGSENALNTLRYHMLLLQRPDNEKSNVEKIKEYKKQFLEFINNDLNTPKAISLMWKLIRDEKEINNEDKYNLILDFDRIFGLKLEEVKSLKLPDEIVKLVEEREKARKNRDWKEADKIREVLKKKGYLIDDTPDGPIVRKAF